jgi:CubicO group peptidase (beta-lactamase class C family)
LADAVTASAVRSTTLFNRWSAGKALTSTVVHVLAERGLLDYDASVAEYWPEFARRGKHRITVAHVLTHTAGVPQAPAGIGLPELAEWDGMCGRIAALAPLWEPGAVTGYHALTFGYIPGEVVRRITGRPIAQVLREEVSEPLGIADESSSACPSKSTVGWRAWWMETGRRP